MCIRDRYRAHKLLNKKRILAYVIDADTNKDTMYMALIENIQREDLNPIEEAKGYKYLQEHLQSSITEIAKTVGKSRPAVSNALRLLKLPDEIQESILKGEINAGQARAILQRKTTQGKLFTAHVLTLALVHQMHDVKEKPLRKSCSQRMC